MYLSPASFSLNANNARLPHKTITLHRMMAHVRNLPHLAVRRAVRESKQVMAKNSSSYSRIVDDKIKKKKGA